MKRPLLVIIIISLLAMIFVSLYYYLRWKPMWSYDEPRKFYPITHHQDDTLRIVMIGDSWVGMRTDILNQLFQKRLSAISGRPVILKSKGKGGEKSRGIYQLMFEEDGLGTKPLLESGADYCIVFAGINDAAANLGTKQFCVHYRMIINFLLSNNIRPVIIEIPDVDIWNIYGNKPKKDLLIDLVRSTMTNCRMYNMHEYRDALYKMLQEEELMQHIVYVPMKTWNGDGVEINPSLFMDDKIHLNLNGYKKLDIQVVTAIVCDLQQMQDSAFVNQPVNNDTQ